MIDDLNENILIYRDFIRQSRSFAATGLTSILRLLLLKFTAQFSKKKILFITNSEQSSLKYQNDLKNLFDINSSVFPIQNISMYDDVSRNLYDYSAQLEILKSKPNIVITPVKNLLEKWIVFKELLVQNQVCFHQKTQLVLL